MGSFHHRKSPSSDRFFGLYSNPGKIGGGGGGELEEDDVFWAGADFSTPEPEFSPAAVESLSSGRVSEKRFGILAALSEEEESRRGLRSAGFRRTPSSGWTIPSIPKTKKEEHLAVRQQQSAPVNVPIGLRRVERRFPVEVEVGDDDDEEMLPPHEIVAKGLGKEEPLTTFSVLEGLGRTLKGRDLRRVRNAVWRQTGFLD